MQYSIQIAVTKVSCGQGLLLRTMTAPETSANQACWSFGEAQSGPFPTYMRECVSEGIRLRKRERERKIEHKDVYRRRHTSEERLEVQSLDFRLRGGAERKVGREDDLLPVHAYFDFACTCLFSGSSFLSLIKIVGLPSSCPIVLSFTRSHTIFQPPSTNLGPSPSSELFEDEFDAVRNVKEPLPTEKPKSGFAMVRGGTASNCSRLVSVSGM